jgi:acetoin utilization deacetylase AcuC-like enzyme
MHFLVSLWMDELTTAARETTQRTETLKKRQTGDSYQLADPLRLAATSRVVGSEKTLRKRSRVFCAANVPGIHVHCSGDVAPGQPDSTIGPDVWAQLTAKQ